METPKFEQPIDSRETSEVIPSQDERNEKMGEAATQAAESDAETSKEKLVEEAINTVLETAFLTDKQHEIAGKCESEEEYVAQGVEQFGKAFQAASKAYEEFARNGSFNGDALENPNTFANLDELAKAEADPDYDPELHKRIIFGAEQIGYLGELLDEGKIKTIDAGGLSKKVREIGTEEKKGVIASWSREPLSKYSQEKCLKNLIAGFSAMADSIEDVLAKQYQKETGPMKELKAVDDKIGALLAKHQKKAEETTKPEADTGDVEPTNAEQ